MNPTPAISEQVQTWIEGQRQIISGYPDDFLRFSLQYFLSRKQRSIVNPLESNQALLNTLIMVELMQQEEARRAG